MRNILQIENLDVVLKSSDKKINHKILEDINFDVNENEIFGIIGESGSGKSILANSIMGLLPEPNITIISGKILFDGIDISKIAKPEMVNYRNKRIALITQEPYSSFDPISKIKEQIYETLLINNKFNKKDLENKALDLLNNVDISDPKDVLERYPHELSTGMLQRILIAISTINKPDLLIADEPTSSLDLVIQKKIIELILNLKKKKIIKSIIFISHNINLVENICDRLLVLYAGMAQEIGNAKEISRLPLHPYTEGIINAIPNPFDKNKKILVPIPGNSPDLYDYPEGCKFFPRCKYKFDKCENEEPNLREIENQKRLVRCHINFDTDGNRK